MTTVFLSGSRKISQLDEAVTSRLSTIVEKEFHVIVGDANGADKAFQATLASMDYANVTVFCSGPECRNNMGQWNVKHVSVDAKFKGRAFYTQKDKAMAGEADCCRPATWSRRTTPQVNWVSSPA